MNFQRLLFPTLNSCLFSFRNKEQIEYKYYLYMYVCNTYIHSMYVLSHPLLLQSKYFFVRDQMNSPVKA